MPLIDIIDTAEAVNAEDGETILSAVQRAGVAFSHSCLAGNCGSCKCELIDGDIYELERSEFALTDAERASGLILACRTQVWGDTRIRRLAEDELIVHPSRILNCHVSHLETLTHDIRAVHLTPYGAAAFLYSPGQFASVEFLPGIERQYSMAGIAADATLQFHVRRVPGGKTSTHVVEQLREGDAVTVRGPLGSSYLREQHAGPVLLVAGGSGLAPIESILRGIFAQAAPGGERAPVRLYFGARAERDIYHEALLSAWARDYPWFSYDIVLSDDSSTRRRRGFVHDALAGELASVTGMKAYLAGPPPMVEATTGFLKDQGMAMRDIHADAFYDQ